MIPFFKKVITEKRGGINLELNLLLYHLLVQIGYDCHITSASFPLEDDRFGPTYQHMILLVNLNDQWWVADVGLEEAMVQPQPLVASSLAIDYNRYLRFMHDVDDWWYLQQSTDTVNFQHLFRFKTSERQFIEFLDMCRFYDSNPDSQYRKGKFITQLFEDGRITLTDRQLIDRSFGQKEAIEILNEDAYFAKLEQHFGISWTNLVKQGPDQ